MRRLLGRLRSLARGSILVADSVEAVGDGLAPSKGGTLHAGAGAWRAFPTQLATGRLFSFNPIPSNDPIPIVEDDAGETIPTFVRDRIHAYPHIFSTNSHNAGNHIPTGCGGGGAIGSGSRSECTITKAGTLAFIVVQTATDQPIISIDKNASTVQTISFEHPGELTSTPGMQDRCVIVEGNGTSFAAGDALEVSSSTGLGECLIYVFIKPAVRMGLVYQFAANVSSASNYAALIVNAHATATPTTSATPVTPDRRHEAIMPVGVSGASEPMVFGWRSTATGGGAAQTIRVIGPTWTHDVDIQAGTSGTDNIAGIGFTAGRGDPISIQYRPNGTPGTAPGNLSCWLYLPMTDEHRDGYVIPFCGDTAGITDAQNLSTRANPTQAVNAATHTRMMFPVRSRALGHADAGMLCDVVGQNENGADQTLYIQVGAELRKHTLEATISDSDEDVETFGPLAWQLAQARPVLISTEQDEGEVAAWGYFE